MNLPWKDVVVDTRDYTVYKDGFPVTEGHILFVPKEETWDKLAACYKAAYAWGYEWVQNGYCDAYNLGQNIGAEAGQTVLLLEAGNDVGHNKKTAIYSNIVACIYKGGPTQRYQCEFNEKPKISSSITHF